MGRVSNRIYCDAFVARCTFWLNDTFHTAHCTYIPCITCQACSFCMLSDYYFEIGTLYHLTHLCDHSYYNHSKNRMFMFAIVMNRNKTAISMSVVEDLDSTFNLLTHFSIYIYFFSSLRLFAVYQTAVNK